ncbi:MAG: alpha/beta fold hydrolase [Chloroflexi bacterium]|nr:alpha/beta fold hydrolase [Chloroflexota bacterium]
MNKRLFIGIVVTLLILFGAVVGAGTYIFNRITAVDAQCLNRPEDVDNRPDNFARERFDLSPYFMQTYETVEFRSRDGEADLSGWYVPVEDSSTAIIIVHGVNDCKQRSFTLTAAGMLHNAGYNVLLMDMRNHGESEVTTGRHAGGTNELYDVLGAWDWLVEEQNFAPPSIGVLGFSLGAATSIMAAGEEPQIAAVWADSSFAAIDDIARDELERAGIPRFVAPWSIAVGEAIYGTDITSNSPFNAIQKFDGRPVFFVHGTGDERVKHQYSEDLAVEVGETVWLVDGAAHIESIWDAMSDYEQRLVAFFDEALQRVVTEETDNDAD